MTIRTWFFIFIALMALSPFAQAKQELWVLDNLSCAGGRHVTVEGHPQVISWPGGRAVEFDGLHDSLFIKGRPLIGVARFTIEVMIRPDGGEFEQKFLHVAETDQTSGADVRPKGDNHDVNNRIMFELRAVENGFYLDGFLNSGVGNAGLATSDHVHPTGQWYVVAQTFDGTHYRTYVDGVMQGEMLTKFAPQNAGNVRIGARMNGVAYFKGAIARIRFTDRALMPSELMTIGERRK